MSLEDMEEYEIVGEPPHGGSLEVLAYCYGEESAEERKKHIQAVHPKADIKKRKRGGE